MTKQEFEATDGLLEDVMRKQAGTLEKAVLEGVMNSVDAGASTVEVTVEEQKLVIEDDGHGMSEEDINTYFKKFGLKDDDVENKEFGKFRMGRGQIFNFGRNVWRSNNNVMVVDLNNDESAVSIDSEERVVDTSGLSFTLLESKGSYDGCSVAVDLYSPIPDIQAVTNDIKGLIKYIPWLHDVDVYINGEEVMEGFEYDHETETAYYKVGTDNWNTRTTVYNKGAKVKDFGLNKTGGVIVTKKDLDVNFSRNDILETCEVWERVREGFNNYTIQHIHDSSDLSTNECKWALEQMAEDDYLRKTLSGDELVHDVRGNRWSIDQLSGQKVTFADSDNKLVRNAEESNGVIAIKSEFASYVRGVMDSVDAKELSDFVQDEMKWEMRDYDEDELSKRRRNNLKLARWFLRELGFSGEVKAGYSDTFDIWKDDEEDLYFHKNVLNQSKAEFRFETLLESVRYAANGSATVEGVEEDYEYQRKLKNFYKRLPEAVRKMESGNPHK